MKSVKLNLLFNKKRHGSTLMLVAVMSAVVVLLGTAVLTAVVSSNSVATHTDNAQQAYFTARSAAYALKSYVSNLYTTNKLDAYLPIGGNNSSTTPTQIITTNKVNMGYYSYNISRTLDGDTIKISTNGYYPNKSQGDASIYLLNYSVSSGTIVYSGPPPIDNPGNPSVPVDPIVPPGGNNVGGANAYNNIFYINSKGTTSIGQSTVNGNIVTNGPLTFGNSTTFIGKIFANGAVSISGAGSSKYLELDANGDITLTGSGNVSGDVNATGNASLQGGTSIGGSIFANGTLYMDGSAKIAQNATIGGSVTMSGAPYIGGTLTTASTYSLPSNSISTFIGGSAKQNQFFTPVSIAAPTQVETIISAPSQSADPNLYTPVTFSSYSYASGTVYSAVTISGDGTFNLSNYQFLYGATITVNTSSQNINLLVNNSQSLSGINIIVSGSHNLYIYLASSATQFNVGSNCFVGTSNASATPQVFIMGTNQSMSITNCGLDAYIYLPSGSLSASGSSFDQTDIYRGSAVVNTLSIGSGLSFTYIAPNLIGTPLAGLS